MRLASSWMVITSGMITSRMTLSRGWTTPAWRSFSRSRRRLSEASERSRCASSKALLMVSLMRSRRSSLILTGLLGGLAPFFLARDSSSASASTSSARGPRLAGCSTRLGASAVLVLSGAFSLGRSLTSAGSFGATSGSVFSAVRLGLGGRDRLFLDRLGLGRRRPQRLEARTLGRFRLGTLPGDLERTPACFQLVVGQPTGPLQQIGQQLLRLVHLERIGVGTAGTWRSCASSSSRPPPILTGRG